jgi:hypothetical protein
MTSSAQILAVAISLVWLACVVICVLKGKYGMAIGGFVAAVAQEVRLPPIGGYYILNLLYPFWVLPIFGALRLAHPKSYWAWWFYRNNMPKYYRAVQRFGLEEEYKSLIAKEVSAEVPRLRAEGKIKAAPKREPNQEAT